MNASEGEGNYDSAGQAAVVAFFLLKSGLCRSCYLQDPCREVEWRLPALALHSHAVQRAPDQAA